MKITQGKQLYFKDKGRKTNVKVSYREKNGQNYKKWMDDQSLYRQRVIINKMNDESRKTKPHVNPVQLRRKQMPPRNKELNVQWRMTNDETELT